MNRYIIIKFQDVSELVPKDSITELEDLVVTNEDDSLKIFQSMDGAYEYREKHQIDSQIIELPIY